MNLHESDIFASEDRNSERGVSRSPPDDRDTFIYEMRQQLDRIQTEMARMRDDVSRMGGDLKEKADEKLQSLEKTYRDFRAKLEAFKTSTEDNWRRDKEGFHKSFSDFATHFKGLFK